MAKNQILVHLHTSAGELSAITREVRVGEIIVRHANNKPELYTKKDNGEFATFIDSVAIDAKISAAQTTLQTNIDNLNTKVDNFSAATVSALSAASAYTDAQVANAVASAQTFADGAKDAAIASAKTYTDAQVSATTATLEGLIDGVESKVDTLSATVESFSASVIDNYATSAATEAAIATAKGEAIAAASAYTDGQVAGLKEYVDAEVLSARTDAKNAVDALDSKVEELSGSVETLKEDLEESIAAAVTKAYVYKGSVEAYENLPEDAENGDVWNVATESVVDGKVYPAGTNWAWVAPKEEGGEGHWDALGGIVDLTPYATSADTHNAIAAVQGQVDTLDTKVDNFSAGTEAAIASARTYAEEKATAAKGEAIAAASAYTDGQVAGLKEYVDAEVLSARTDANNAVDAVSRNLTALSGNVHTKFTEYATSADTEAAIAKAKGEAIAAASAYTDGQVVALSGHVVTEVARLDGRVDATNTRVEALEAISGATQTAVQEIAIAGIEGVSASASGTTWTIDFTNMVVDCGEF